MDLLGRRREAPPLSLTIVGWIFIGVGIVSLVAGSVGYLHPTDRPGVAPGDNAHHARDLLFVVISALVAITGGALVLRGDGRGRWLLVAWLVFHVLLSALHALDALLIHAALCAVGFYVLFRPAATDYFRNHARTRDDAAVP